MIVKMAKQIRSILVYLFLALVVMAVPALVSCGPATPAAPAGEIKIGIVYSTGGPSGATGSQLLLGAQLAMDYYNKELGGITVNGKKYTASYLELSPDSNPQQGVSVVKRLIEVDKVPFIIGDCISGVVAAQQPVIEEAKYPWIMNAATDKLTTSGFKYTNRCNSSSGVMDEYYWQSAMAALPGKTKIAILATATDYGKGKVAAAKINAPKFGGQIVYEDTFAAGTSEFAAVLTKIKTTNPDIIYMPNYGEIVAAMKQAKEMGFKVQWVTNDTVTPVELAKNLGDTLIGLQVMTSRNPIATTESQKTYNKHIIAVKGPESIYAATYPMGWDAAVRTFKTFELAGTLDDKVKLAESIRKVSWDGGMSQGSFDATGQIEVTAYIIEVTNATGGCKLVAAKGKLVS
jgi:branched-chain amino acid transport system substrate-binding protein